MEDEEQTLQKKHQLMLERLSARHQTRLETLKSDPSDSSTTSAFLSRFNDSKKSIATQIESSVDPSRLPDISAAISDLEKFVAENSYLLPFYEIRSCLKTISDLKQSLENLTSQLIPKKKFSFKKSKPTKNQIKSRIPQPDTVLVPEKTTSYTIRDSPGFSHKQNQVLVQNFKGSEIGEFTISDLDSCEVKLIGCVNALFVNRLKNCKIYAGPVVGSILMEEVEDCVFVLASHQIRIHFAKRSDFYLRVRSRPIIEDSDGVRFANYCLKYEGIEEDLAVAVLDEETGNWANVDDFKWLRAMQSPNWSILPEEERVGDVDLANSNSSTSLKPDLAGFAEFLKPLNEAITKANAKTEGRRSNFFNQLKVATDSLLALAWIAYMGKDCGGACSATTVRLCFIRMDSLKQLRSLNLEANQLLLMPTYIGSAWFISFISLAVDSGFDFF